MVAISCSRVKNGTWCQNVRHFASICYFHSGVMALRNIISISRTLKTCIHRTSHFENVDKPLRLYIVFVCMISLIITPGLGCSFSLLKFLQWSYFFVDSRHYQLAGRNACMQSILRGLLSLGPKTTTKLHSGFFIWVLLSIGCEASNAFLKAVWSWVRDFTIYSLKVKQTGFTDVLIVPPLDFVRNPILYFSICYSSITSFQSWVITHYQISNWQLDEPAQQRSSQLAFHRGKACSQVQNRDSEGVEFNFGLLFCAGSLLQYILHNKTNLQPYCSSSIYLGSSSARTESLQYGW